MNIRNLLLQIKIIHWFRSVIIRIRLGLRIVIRIRIRIRRLRKECKAAYQDDQDACKDSNEYVKDSVGSSI